MANDPQIPPLLSVTQVGNELGITRQAVLKMVAAGQLPGRKVGSTWVFRAAVVNRLKSAAKPRQE